MCSVQFCILSSFVLFYVYLRFFFTKVHWRKNKNYYFKWYEQWITNFGCKDTNVSTSYVLYNKLYYCALLKNDKIQYILLFNLHVCDNIRIKSKNYRRTCDTVESYINRPYKHLAKTFSGKTFRFASEYFIFTQILGWNCPERHERQFKNFLFWKTGFFFQNGQILRDSNN